MLRQRGRLLKRRTTITTTTTTTEAATAEAIPCHLYAGGFNFGPASLLEHVPYDSKLHHLFFGEELSMAVRLFTHGYDLYAPPETVCYHLWSRSHRPTNNTIIATTTPQKLTPQEEDDAEKKLEQRRLSLEIVRRQLRGDSSILHAGSSSLGTVRTAAQFAERLGVDFERQTLNEGCQNGGLTANDFCDAQQQQLFPEDSVEAKVASLDLNAQRLIAFFLSGANEAKPPPK
jgi:[Skp1-protein]-hydroxyproline N-acetylglucosaminyltransferase